MFPLKRLNSLGGITLYFTITVNFLQLKYPCETVSKYLLPTLRSLIAKGLIEDYGFTQVAAAEKLGTTQAAISYYLSSKRGQKHIKQLDNDSQTKSTIKVIVNGLGRGTLSSNEVIQKLCELCLSLRKSEYTLLR